MRNHFYFYRCRVRYNGFCCRLEAIKIGASVTNWCRFLPSRANIDKIAAHSKLVCHNRLRCARVRNHNTIDYVIGPFQSFKHHVNQAVTHHTCMQTNVLRKIVLHMPIMIEFHIYSSIQMKYENCANSVLCLAVAHACHTSVCSVLNQKRAQIGENRTNTGRS